ncbi:MAG: aminotransferase class I/II-fold pyridoxal phosphate-dependent enzyme [Treponema sp.]|jgi:aspartate/methionine/tyrosine aminotransferase|nr:aminotransferase class I/II-fold pyridoxal phosphate-dependent enzyme [Treponema sp.]
MNLLAEELNTILDNSVSGRLLSPAGRRLYFPKGIIAQSAEAKKNAGAANATIGMAYKGGKPLMLQAVAESIPGLSPEQTVAYAPTAGIEQIRTIWKKLILQKNPSLGADDISLPALVPGLTSGISIIADLFLPGGETLISSGPCWDNYSLIFEERCGGILRLTPFLGDAGLDMDAIAKAIKSEAEKGYVRIILNFPNNPAGYSPTRDEARALAELLKETAEKGADVLALCDDAYFGLFYEDDLFQESMFSLLAKLHERILAVKIDGPIKEAYIWGLRIGFVTFGGKGLAAADYDALVTKLMGAIRSSVSCANTPAQHIVAKALEDPRTPGEIKEYRDLMQRRYQAVKAFVKANPGHPVLTPFPFNSGYFMSFRCKGVSAEAIRKELLAKHGIGVISLGDNCLRAAFSSLEEEQIRGVFKVIYDTAAALKG